MPVEQGLDSYNGRTVYSHIRTVELELEPEPELVVGIEAQNSCTLVPMYIANSFVAELVLSGDDVRGCDDGGDGDRSF